MFELVSGKTDRPFRDRAPFSKCLAVTFHITVIVLVVGIPLLTATNVLPEVPTMMAFVAAVPSPPPPPPPPPPARPSAAEPAPRPEPKPTGAFAAPLDAPSEVKPEATTASAETAGVVGGVEGGVPGGVDGGIVGGIMPAPPPPPPTPPPAPRGPVRIGGQLMAPALTHRVDPVFSDLAVAAHLTGVVILEATVDTEGRVQSVTVLRSRHPILDRASVEALKQWRYSPLVLNDIPTPFVLTVTFNFSVGP